MTSAKSFLAVICALGLGTAALAQDTAAPETGADAEAPAAEAGTTAPQPPQPGQTYIRETHGDFELRCVKLPEDRAEDDPCALYQLLENAEGQAVAEFSIFRLPEGGQAVAGATLVAPLETLLTQDVQMRVDQGPVRRYPFTYCNAGGCLARLGFTAEEVERLKRGAKAEIRLVSAAAPDREFFLPLSLTGFTAGYAQVSERN